METIVQRFWPLGIICALYAAFVIYLLLKHRVTLQNSLAFLFLLLTIGGAAIFAPYVAGTANRFGFVLPSNFFFALSIGALSTLHLLTLSRLSRIELRSITLVQEVALLHERFNAETLAASSARPEESSLVRLQSRSSATAH